MQLFDADPARVVEATIAAWTNLRKTTPDWDAWLERLTANRLTGFVQCLREFRS